MINYLILLASTTVVLAEHNSINYNRNILQINHPSYGKELTLGEFPNPKALSRSWLEYNLFAKGTFTLYTRDIPQGLLITDISLLNETSFHSDNPTKFITHGWRSSGTDDICITIKDAYLMKGNFNVFILDWSKLARKSYPQAKKATRPVGKFYGNFLNKLVNEKGVDPKNLHLIGHSLGAHISGFAARAVKNGKVGRVTGLDPAAFLYLAPKLFEHTHLNMNDADFVDVIHTAAVFYGLKLQIGHADFYPNGGQLQPGCSFLVGSCSHSRSWELFAESILQSEPSMATHCESLEFSRENCNGEKVAFGDPAPSYARGIYYLTTADKAPFLRPLPVEDTNLLTEA